tara:strand:- start:58 stop:291 length:234 start_codon:yes stop_codon:yes gene_type:complete
MKGALASLWGKANSAERFTSIVLITLWVVGTAWFFAEIFKVCEAAASAVFIPYVVVTVVVMLALLWMLVRAGVRQPQ